MSICSIRVLLFFCCVLLGAGLSGPSMTVVPQFGRLNTLVAMFKPELTHPETFSLLRAIAELVSDGGAGQLFVGLILFVFSVLFPIAKLAILWSGAAAVHRGASPATALTFIEHHGKLSMLDIYVMALVVLAIKGLPGGTSVTLNWGAAAFAVSILLSLKVPRWIKQRAAAADVS